MLKNGEQMNELGTDLIVYFMNLRITSVLRILITEFSKIMTLGGPKRSYCVARMQDNIMVQNV
jgi:hypothetical protein